MRQGDQLECLCPRFSFAADNKVGLGLDHLGEPLPYHGMIVHDQDAMLCQLGAHDAFAWILQMTLVPPHSRRSISSLPPTIRARYCMVCNPIPVKLSNSAGIPIPLSDTLRVTAPPTRCNPMTMCVARECRTALVTASCAMRYKCVATAMSLASTFSAHSAAQSICNWLLTSVANSRSAEESPPDAI